MFRPGGGALGALVSERLSLRSPVPEVAPEPELFEDEFGVCAMAEAPFGCSTAARRLAFRALFEENPDDPAFPVLMPGGKATGGCFASSDSWEPRIVGTVMRDASPDFSCDP